MESRLRAAALTTAAAAALLALLIHRPGTGMAPGDPSAAIVVAATWLAWVLVVYLLAAVAIAAAGHLGASSSVVRSAGRIGKRFAPRPVRRFVDTLIGATAAVVVVTGVGPVAAYADATPRPTATAGSGMAARLDWPGLPTSPQTHPRPERPVLLTSPTRRHAEPGPDIVVRSGDSLWTLTAHVLGPGASAAEVAVTWPRLYAANRAVIGTDPGLIHPGQRLVPPAPETRSPR